MAIHLKPEITYHFNVQDYWFKQSIAKAPDYFA